MILEFILRSYADLLKDGVMPDEIVIPARHAAELQKLDAEFWGDYAYDMITDRGIVGAFDHAAVDLFGLTVKVPRNIETGELQMDPDLRIGVHGPGRHTDPVDNDNSQNAEEPHFFGMAWGII